MQTDHAGRRSFLTGLVLFAGATSLARRARAQAATEGSGLSEAAKAALQRKRAAREKVAASPSRSMPQLEMVPFDARIGDQRLRQLRRRHIQQHREHSPALADLEGCRSARLLRARPACGHSLLVSAAQRRRGNRAAPHVHRRRVPCLGLRNSSPTFRPGAMGPHTSSMTGCLIFITAARRTSPSRASATS